MRPCFTRLGSLSKDDGYDKDNATRLIGTHFSVFLCHTLQNNNAVKKNIRFLKTTWAYNNEPFIVYFPLKPFVPIQLQDSSPVLYKLNKREYSWNTGDSAKLYFGVTFSLSLLCLNYLLWQVWGPSAVVLQGTLVCCRMDLFRPRYHRSHHGNADDSANDSHSKKCDEDIWKQGECPGKPEVCPRWEMEEFDWKPKCQIMGDGRGR